MYASYHVSSDMSSSNIKPPLRASDPSFNARESRLQFSPSYAIVGVYRLITDPYLYRPIWAKVQHGTQRGLIVGFAWVSLFLTLRNSRSLWFSFVLVCSDIQFAANIRSFLLEKVGWVAREDGISNWWSSSKLTSCNWSIPRDHIRL